MNDTVVVELLSAPERISEPDREVVTARGQTLPDRTPVTVTLLPHGPGEWNSLRQGDKLVCAVVGGRLQAGVHPLAWAGPATPGRLVDTVKRARAGGHLVLGPAPDDSASEVLLGPDGDREAVMLYPDAHADLLELKAKLVSALNKIGALQNAASPGTGAGAIADAATLNTTIVGGRAAVRVKATRS